jgi:hypothetical protein
MAGNGSDLIFPAGNIKNSAPDPQDIPAADGAVCENAPETADNWQHISEPVGRIVDRMGRGHDRAAYSAEELALFAAYRANRERCRPDACHSGTDCWVENGPPCFGRLTSSGRERCLGCGGLPRRLPHEIWRAMRARAGL